MRYFDVDTRVHWMQVVEYLQSIPFDILLVTGDVTQDHLLPSYQFLAESVQRLSQPCFWLPGNHDDISQLSATLSSLPWYSQKQIHWKHWQILLLDSKGETPAGWLDELHLEELEQALKEHTGYSALFCHHHPVALNIALDKHRLANGERLIELSTRYPQIQFLAHGHIHQAEDYRIDSLSIHSAPATSVQFLPHPSQWIQENQGPGLRRFILHADGRYQSDFIWLNKHRLFSTFTDS